MRPKTILIVRNAYSWQYGGAEQFTFNLANQLKGLGYGAVVVTRVPELLEKANRAAIKTYKNIWLRNETQRRWAPVYYLLAPLLVLQYAYYILRSGAATVLLTGRDEQIYGTVAASILGRRVVWMDHADMKGITSQPLRFLGKMYFWSLSKAKAIIVVSESEKKYIQSSLDKVFWPKLEVINNGAILDTSSSHKIFDPGSQKVVSYIARVEQEKGIDEFVGAAIELLSQRDDVVFAIAGKGERKDYVEQAIKGKNLVDKVRLVGHLTNIYDLLSISTIFVYPSYHDASPLAPVEALLAGVPVVASNVGGIPEMVTPDVGILVAPKSKELLTKAVKRLLDDPKMRTAMSKQAKAYNERYDFQQIVEQRYVSVLNLTND